MYDECAQYTPFEAGSIPGTNNALQIVYNVYY